MGAGAARRIRKDGGKAVGRRPFVKARDGTSAACTGEGRAVQKQKRKGSAKPHRRSTPENSCPNSTARRAAAVRASRMQRQSRSDKLSRCVRWRTGSARRYPHPAGAQKCRRKRHAHHRRDEPPVLQQQTKLPAQAAERCTGRASRAAASERNMALDADGPHVKAGKAGTRDSRYRRAYTPHARPNPFTGPSAPSPAPMSHSRTASPPRSGTYSSPDAPTRPEPSAAMRKTSCVPSRGNGGVQPTERHLLVEIRRRCKGRNGDRGYQQQQRSHKPFRAVSHETVPPYSVLCFACASPPGGSRRIAVRKPPRALVLQSLLFSCIISPPIAAHQTASEGPVRQKRPSRAASCRAGRKAYDCFCQPLTAPSVRP